MASKTVTWKMRQRQGTSAQWESQNPVLAAGEFGYDTTKDIVKIGDGSKHWNDLPSFVKKTKKSLEEYTWEEISQIARDWEAPLYFNIGDEKTITLTTGEKVTLVILDFWHDMYYDEDEGEDMPAGITFGLKNTLETLYQMNTTGTNVGGWANSRMRTSTLRTIWNQLPAEVRDVIIPVKKYTSAGNKSTTVNDTEDDIWLLSRVEVDGTTENVYKDEGYQYPYFTRHNSTQSPYGCNPNYVKARGNSGGAYGWWLRSPYVSNADSFWCVTDLGDVYPYPASGTRGLAFGFCV